MLKTRVALQQQAHLQLVDGVDVSTSYQATNAGSPKFSHLIMCDVMCAYMYHEQIRSPATNKQNLEK